MNKRVFVYAILFLLFAGSVTLNVVFFFRPTVPEIEELAKKSGPPAVQALSEVRSHRTEPPQKDIPKEEMLISGGDSQKLAELLGLGRHETTLPEDERQDADTSKPFVEREYSSMTVRFSRKTGQLVRLVNLEEQHVPEDATYEDGLQEQAALEMTRGIVEATPLPQGVEIAYPDARISRADFYSKKVNDLQGAVWTYYAPYKYEGRPVMGGIMVDLSAFDGRVIRYSAADFAVSEQDEKIMPEQEARKTAEEVLRSRGMTPVREPTAQLIYERPNNLLNAAPGEGFSFGPEYVLCWNVRYAVTMGGHEHSVRVSLRADSGECAGMAY